MYIAKKDSFENWRSLLMPPKLRCKKFCRLQSLWYKYFSTYSLAATLLSFRFLFKSFKLQTSFFHRLPSDRSQTRRASLGRGRCSIRSCPSWCPRPWRTRSVTFWSRSSTASCTNWMTWCGPTSTRSWSSSSRCWSTRTTTPEWRAGKSSLTWQR